MLYKILLSGDGGQGIQLLSDIICRACFNRGWHVSHIPNYGLEQRGGVSLAFIQISDREIAYPKFSEPDILLAMSAQAEERTRQFSFFNFHFLIADYGDVLKKNNIPHQSYNVFFLSMLAKILEEKGVLKRGEVFGLLEKKLSAKPNWGENKRAWDLGIEN